MITTEYSLLAQSGGQSSKLAASGASVQSAVIAFYAVTVTPTVDVFFRRGVNPVAVLDVDQILLAGGTYRLFGFGDGDKLAFIANGASGLVYLSPGA